MSKFKVLLLYPNTMQATLLPIGICSLSASLKQAGFDVELFDSTYYKTEAISFEKKKEELLQVKPFEYAGEFKGGTGDMLIDLKNMVNDYKPDLIGISLVEDTIDLGLLMLKAIKVCGIPVIAGGVGVNWNWERLEKIGLVNAICIGEGEKTLVVLAELLRKEPTYFKDQDVVKVFNDEPLDINKLPYPDFSIFPDDRITRVMHGQKYRMLHVEVDRGCPYNCTYCCASALKRLYGKGYYRRKSNGRIIAELDHMKRYYNPDYVDINSETLLARSVENLKDLFNAYKLFIDIPFWCQARPEDITEEKIKILKDADIADFQLGIEHGNAYIRSKILNRKGSNKTIINACNLLHEYEIPFTVNMIMLPNIDTRETVFDSIELCQEIDGEFLKTINVYHLSLYRGTKLFDYYLEKGWIPEDTRTNQLLDGNLGFKWEGMDVKEFKGLQRAFPLYVKYGNRAKGSENNDYIYSHLREEYIKEFYS